MRELLIQVSIMLGATGLLFLVSWGVLALLRGIRILWRLMIGTHRVEKNEIGH